MVRKALRGQRDPVITASFALGRTWPLLLTLVFGSGLIGGGVTGGWFTSTDADVTRLVFAVAAVAAFATAVWWHKNVLLLGMTIIMVTCLGRSWAIAHAYVQSRKTAPGGATTLLVGSFIWIALAVAEFIFTVALLTLVAVRSVVDTAPE